MQGKSHVNKIAAYIIYIQVFYVLAVKSRYYLIFAAWTFIHPRQVIHINNKEL